MTLAWTLRRSKAFQLPPRCLLVKTGDHLPNILSSHSNFLTILGEISLMLIPKLSPQSFCHKTRTPTLASIHSSFHFTKCPPSGLHQRGKLFRPPLSPYLPEIPPFGLESSRDSGEVPRFDPWCDGHPFASRIKVLLRKICKGVLGLTWVLAALASLVSGL